MGDSIEADSNQPQNVNTKSMSSAMMKKEKNKTNFDYPETEDERIVNQRKKANKDRELLNYNMTDDEDIKPYKMTQKLPSPGKELP